MMRRWALLAVLVIAVVLAASFATYETNRSSSSPCVPIRGGSVARSQTSKVQFGAVMEYALPGLDRYPNAVTNASDGSVWFAEEEVPGVGHLFPNNGTLVEYAWPNYPTPQPPGCFVSASVSGIALWNGRVWGADQFGNAIVGINPAGGTAASVNTTGRADSPYWLAVGPDGELWFTSYSTPARLGRIAPNLTMEIINLSGLGKDEPLTLDFVNSSLAYLSTVSISTYSSKSSCSSPSSRCASGHIYSFNPSDVSPAITPQVVGAGFNLTLPTSASYSNGGLWVAQHDSSTIAEYDVAAKTWTMFPTSTVPYAEITLPLVTEAVHGQVWFNEHYANKISHIDSADGILTEYSESNPPASNFTGIQNDLSMVAADGGAWFTSLSGNYVGFVNGSYDPGWDLSVSGADTGTLRPGGNATFHIEVSGSWSAPMGVSVSDSENLTAIPKLIQIVPRVSSIPAGGAPYDLEVKIAVNPVVRPGGYTAAVTVTNGLTQRTAYLFISVQ
jgi:streptogramin lyase